MASFTSGQKYKWDVKSWKFMQEHVYATPEMEEILFDVASDIARQLNGDIDADSGEVPHYNFDVDVHKKKYARAAVYTVTRQAKDFESRVRNMDRFGGRA